MSEDWGSPFGRREHNPSAAAADPADETIARRVFSRLGRSRGMIPPEAAEELPGRIARLAQGRLPLLDALQRRWGSSAAAWPDATDLPLVTGFAGARGAEMALQVGDARSSPASSAGTLPVVEARPAGRDTTISDPLRGWSEGEAGPAASQPDIAGAAPRTTVGSGLTETRPALPVVKISRSPAQRDSALPAEGVATGALPTPAAEPLPVMRGQMATDDRGRPATAPLQRRIFATGDEPAAASRSPEHSAPDATGSEIPAHPGVAT